MLVRVLVCVYVCSYLCVCCRGAGLACIVSHVLLAWLQFPTACCVCFIRLLMGVVSQGPGEYRVPAFTDGKGKGGVIEKAKASSMMDQVIKRALRVPGPANYETAQSSLTHKGAVIPAAASLSLMDIAVKRAAAIPGVCACVCAWFRLLCRLRAVCLCCSDEN